MGPSTAKKISNPSGAGQKEVEPDPTPLEPKWGVQGLWVAVVVVDEVAVEVVVMVTPGGIAGSEQWRSSAAIPPGQAFGGSPRRPVNGPGHRARFS
jgi:hypothetical protein